MHNTRWSSLDCRTWGYSFKSGRISFTVSGSTASKPGSPERGRAELERSAAQRRDPGRGVLGNTSPAHIHASVHTRTHIHREAGRNLGHAGQAVAVERLVSYS